MDTNEWTQNLYQIRDNLYQAMENLYQAIYNLYQIRDNLYQMRKMEKRGDRNGNIFYSCLCEFVCEKRKNGR